MAENREALIESSWTPALSTEAAKTHGLLAVAALRIVQPNKAHDQLPEGGAECDGSHGVEESLDVDAGAGDWKKLQDDGNREQLEEEIGKGEEWQGVAWQSKGSVNYLVKQDFVSLSGLQFRGISDTAVVTAAEKNLNYFIFGDGEPDVGVTPLKLEMEKKKVKLVVKIDGAVFRFSAKKERPLYERCGDWCSLKVEKSNLPEQRDLPPVSPQRDLPPVSEPASFITPASPGNLPPASEASVQTASSQAAAVQTGKKQGGAEFEKNSIARLACHYKLDGTCEWGDYGGGRRLRLGRTTQRAKKLKDPKLAERLMEYFIDGKAAASHDGKAAEPHTFFDVASAVPLEISMNKNRTTLHLQLTGNEFFVTGRKEDSSKFKSKILRKLKRQPTPPKKWVCDCA